MSMMRSLLLAFALSTSLGALSGVPAVAQTTDQTDQSEEDWRKSRKKRDTSDIFQDIKNSGVFGNGINQGPVNPVEALPEDSRRHLMKERAKVIATVETGQTPDAPYNPSEEAKTDPDLAEQEKEAWDVIMTDLKSGGGQGQPGTGPNKIAIAGQGGGSSPSNSTMRGGSTQSVAEILAQIKGMKAGNLGGGSGTQGTDGSGQSPLGTGGGSAPTGQDQQGQSQQAGGQSQGQAQQGQAQEGQAQEASTQAGGEGQTQSDQNGQSESESSSDSRAEASAQSESSSDSQSASDDAAKAAAETAAQAEAQAQAQTHPEPIGPLDRIKKEQASSNGIGSQTSATDFLKKKTDKPD
jgi:hypothetical protein